MLLKVILHYQKRPKIFSCHRHFKDVGLALRDILTLTAYCHSKLCSGGSEQEILKHQLYEKLFGKRSKSETEKLSLKKKRTPNNSASNAAKTIKIYLSWQHYFSDEGRFKQVRLSKGGGIREVFPPLSATYITILQHATATFFPNGISHLGTAEYMIMNLGNFKGHEIYEEEISTFSVETYKEVYNMPRVKIYLLTKEKSK